LQVLPTDPTAKLSLKDALPILLASTDPEFCLGETNGDFSGQSANRVS
jgi:hypothetical protein